MYKFLLITSIPVLLICNPLEKAYKSVVKIENNLVYFKDGTTLIYDDKKEKSLQEKILNSDIEDMLYLKYDKNRKTRTDTGRIRNDNFFKKLYGKTQKEIKQNLVKVKWLPTHSGKYLLFNKNEGAAKNLQKISNELDNLPQKYMKYITKIAGTFNYRVIAGTNRLSTHSFGIAIDLNIKYANYWRWDKKLRFKNQFPKKIVDIFEKYHFIWGGRWYHYDTIHFEYRPELN